MALADGWGTPPAQFEKALPVTWQYYDYRRPRGYDQGPNPSCVWYSGGWGRSIDANIAGLAKYFDADWLYDQACKVGGTKQGTYIWAALKVLQDTGAVEIVNGKQQGPDPEDKIKSFVWAKTWQEIRDAIWNDCPVWFGMPWPWDRPQIKNGEAWVGLTWPTAKYGHAITGFTWSDSRQAAVLVETWGSAWPRITWFGAFRCYCRMTECRQVISAERPAAKGPRNCYASSRYNARSDRRLSEYQRPADQDHGHCRHTQLGRDY